MMLFDENGDIYQVVVPIDNFFELLTIETFKTIYEINYYFFLIECANRFNDDIKCGSKMKTLEDEYYVEVRDLIYKFREHKFSSEVNLTGIEKRLITKIKTEIASLIPFSLN